MHLLVKLLYSCYGSIKLFTKPMQGILSSTKCKLKRIHVFLMRFFVVLLFFACIFIPEENPNENQRPVPASFCSVKPSHQLYQKSRNVGELSIWTKFYEYQLPRLIAILSSVHGWLYNKNCLISRHGETFSVLLLCVIYLKQTGLDSLLLCTRYKHQHCLAICTQLDHNVNFQVRKLIKDMALAAMSSCINRYLHF